MRVQSRFYCGAVEVSLFLLLVKSRELNHPQSTDNPCHKVPDIPNPNRDKKWWQRKDKGDTPKVLDLMDKANILGLVTYQNDILLVYEGQHLSTWHVRRLTLCQTLAVSWTTLGNPRVQAITFNGSAGPLRTLVVGRTSCCCRLDTSKCARSILGGWSRYWKPTRCDFYAPV